jgi:hypothetical protein
VGAVSVDGTVYLLHFMERIGNPANPRAMAQHYIGWALEPATRITKQTAGQGAAIVRAVQARGIGFEVAATWPGTRALERRLKRRKCAPHFCPICQGKSATSP